MKPIPVVFHIGPLQIHTYGIGLALTFLFGLWYFRRRLRDHGYPDVWLTDVFIWILIASIVGARIVHVLANLSFYAHNPLQIPAVWKGGLSSFGGLALGIPTGFWLAHRRCPELPLWVGADLVAPVVVAAWAVGRLLGPQLMIAGGGHPTHQWFGMYYAGQDGKRLPVPIFQAIECTVIWLLTLRVERRVAFRGGRPIGLVTAVAVGLWNLSRFVDEHFWLSYPGHAGAIAVQVAAIVFTVVGLGAALLLVVRDRQRGDPPAAQPVEPEVAATTGSGDAPTP